MNNKTYCITQYSHLELVYFKIQNLNAFYILSIIFNFKISVHLKRHSGIRNYQEK